MFDQVDFDKYDKIGKLTAIKWLTSVGFIVIDNSQKDKYAVDILFGLTKDQLIWSADVEVRKNWKSGNQFPFFTVHVLYRKKKFISKGRYLNISFNQELTYGVYCDSDTILQCPVVEVSTYRSDNELMYDVPRDKCLFIVI